jgi:cellobiose phosphorylase
MYRIWIEEVLGFQVRGDILTLRPILPDEWPGFEMTYRYRSATYEIAVHADGTAGTELDGTNLEDGLIHLADDGAVHHVTVRVSKRPVGAPVEYAPVLQVARTS